MLVGRNAIEAIGVALGTLGTLGTLETLGSADPPAGWTIRPDPFAEFAVPLAVSADPPRTRSHGVDCASRGEPLALGTAAGVD